MFELKVWDAFDGSEYLTGEFATPQLAENALHAWCEPQSASDSEWVAVPDENNDYLNRYFNVYWTFEDNRAVKEQFHAHILKWDND
jgi:hypothetical protein